MIDFGFLGDATLRTKIRCTADVVEALLDKRSPSVGTVAANRVSLEAPPFPKKPGADSPADCEARRELGKTIEAMFAMSLGFESETYTRQIVDVPRAPAPALRYQEMLDSIEKAATTIKEDRLSSADRNLMMQLRPTPMLTGTVNHLQERKWAHRVMYQRQRRFNERPMWMVVRTADGLYVHPDLARKISEAIAKEQ
ncbi:MULTISPECIES: hypothetical protein [Pseudomonas]|uniref:Uncharacterized protein n=1 Tax=Pseudomonas lutea TaxID=243924 RepID=A0A9X8MH31_9PSED|nr:MULTISPECIES: hypothetical protein [Pseudomonas]SER36415.1 hypothetical protein SAMN05216409_11851 [Pseudomonas lutea]